LNKRLLDRGMGLPFVDHQNASPDVDWVETIG